MGRQLHIPSAKCLRVESNFHEQNKFFGEQFQVKYFKYRIMHQSIPAVPIPPPRATTGHLLTLSVLGVGQPQFYRGPGGWALAYPRATPGHLTHVFSKDR